jgi:hypothetical protein
MIGSLYRQFFFSWIGLGWASEPVRSQWRRNTQTPPENRNMTDSVLATTDISGERAVCLLRFNSAHFLLAAYETSLIYQITKRHNPEYITLHKHDGKSLKFNLSYTVSQRLFFSCGVRLSTLGTAATVWPIVPAPDDYDDDDECGAVGGMRIGRGNRSTRRKPAPSVSLSTINPR